MLWLVRANLNQYTESELRLLACAFARSVLHLVPDGEDRPRLVIEAAEAYAADPIPENLARMKDASANAGVFVRETSIDSAAWAADAAGWTSHSMADAAADAAESAAGAAESATEAVMDAAAEAMDADAAESAVHAATTAADMSACADQAAIIRRVLKCPVIDTDIRPAMLVMQY
jgi:hypothetical protein